MASLSPVRSHGLSGGIYKIYKCSTCLELWKDSAYLTKQTKNVPRSRSLEKIMKASFFVPPTGYTHEKKQVLACLPTQELPLPVFWPTQTLGQKIPKAYKGSTVLSSNHLPRSPLHFLWKSEKGHKTIHYGDLKTSDLFPNRKSSLDH